jgi:plastocyanin
LRQTILRAIAIAAFASFAFSMTSYSFVAAQNVTGTAPADNVTAAGNATSLDNATSADNQTGGTTTTANDTEVNTFYARGQIASVISDQSVGDNASAAPEILGGRWKIDVIDGEVLLAEINMTMSKPDGSDFHTMLIDNFTAGGEANTTTANATDAGNTTTSSGNETTQRFLQTITGGNETESAINSTAPGNATGGGNMTAPAQNVTTGNETATAQAISLSQNGTFEISGTATIYMNGNPQWENVPVTIESSGRVITINVDHEMTENHFKGMPIYGFVTALIADVGGSKESVLPPIEAETPAAPAPTGPMPTEPGNGIGPPGNGSAPAGNATGNQTAPAPAADQGGGGAVEVSITSGSSSKTDDAYDPNPVQAKVGDTVTWTNDDSTPHTVTSGSNGQPDGTFDSSPNLNPLMAPAQTFEHTFEEAGEFPYYCAIHPNMAGTVSIS